jgi:hypothetical protein
VDDSAKAIIDAIRSAFTGVPRGQVTVHEAEVIDSYGTDTERRRARRLDIDERWDEVPDAHIEACDNALCHLDPEGWRYYIPAYMVWSLRHFRRSPSMTSDHTIYSFDPCSKDADLHEYQMSRFRLLDHAQSRTVCRFLRYMANDGHADTTVAKRALRTYWGRFGEDADG